MSTLGHIGPKPGSTIEQDFRAFHAANPHVYDTLVSLARRWKARHPGRKAGMKMLYEVARWTVSMNTTGEPVKLNNNFTALYSRLLMEREPDLADLFETRQLHTAEAA